MHNCIFCKIIKGEIPAKIIDQNDKVIVFLDLKNHPLIVTKDHIENIYSLGGEIAAEVMKQAVRISKAVKKGLGADGVNLIQNNEPAAGQEVMHFHMHIRPRWSSDSVRIHIPEEQIDEDKRKTIVEKIKGAL